jgi:hypothetical protein
MFYLPFEVWLVVVGCRPGRVFGRVIGLADAQSAMVEYFQSGISTNEKATRETVISIA